MKLTKYWKSSTSRVFLVTYHRLATIAKTTADTHKLPKISGNHDHQLALACMSHLKRSFFYDSSKEGGWWKMKSNFLFGSPLVPLRITYLWVPSTTSMTIDHSVLPILLTVSINSCVYFKRIWLEFLKFLNLNLKSEKEVFPWYM